MMDRFGTPQTWRAQAESGFRLSVIGSMFICRRLDPTIQFLQHPIIYVRQKMVFQFNAKLELISRSFGLDQRFG
jgi:hypothetical protein